MSSTLLHFSNLPTLQSETERVNGFSFPTHDTYFHGMVCGGFSDGNRNEEFVFHLISILIQILLSFSPPFLTLLPFFHTHSFRNIASISHQTPFCRLYLFPHHPRSTAFPSTCLLLSFTSSTFHRYKAKPKQELHFLRITPTFGELYATDFHLDTTMSVLFLGLISIKFRFHFHHHFIHSCHLSTHTASRK